ncbi:hypothetical protein ACWGIU_34220, partial [Streptomyces sp. NPDC054840]
MRRTLRMAAVMAAVMAALLVPGGPLPVAKAVGVAAPVAVGRWSAREAQSFWTAERMASAAPLPPVPPDRVDAAPSYGLPGPPESAEPGGEDVS